jgi:hypothetical protein
MYIGVRSLEFAHWEVPIMEDCTLQQTKPHRVAQPTVEEIEEDDELDGPSLLLRAQFPSQQTS